LHILGEWGFEFYGFFSYRVLEFYCGCVEGDTVDDWFLGFGLGVGQLPGIDEFSAVHIVGDDGMLDV